MLRLKLVSRPPTMQQMRGICDQWCKMKKELGEPVTAASMKEELVPLITREWKLEVRESD